MSSSTGNDNFLCGVTLVKFNEKRVMEEKAALDTQWYNLMTEMNEGRFDREKLVWLIGRLNVIDSVLMQQRQK